MKVAGFGFRNGATQDALLAALMAAGGPQGLAAIATAADKAGHPAITGLATHLKLPLRAVPLHLLTSQPATPNTRLPARYGHRSVAESAALAAAGPGATLVAKRHTSPDRTATAAIAAIAIARLERITP